MTDKDLRAKIIAFNKARLKDREMAIDFSKLLDLIPDYIKKLLLKDVERAGILNKYLADKFPQPVEEDTKGPSGLLEEEGV